ncbi:MAG TPA: SCP2 sterol-binding domain-containing protein, partial [Steroidobacteraceae bacterium]|nr:SCP2 sterol-binding domain-containing protein [Steroidobacteraceae bacterium]
MLLTGIERILNRSLPESPRAQALAAALAGRSLAVEMTGAGEVVISSTGERIRIVPGVAATADARVCGGPFSLLALAGGSPNPSGTGALVSGDAEVAQQFRELLTLLKPDPEEELSRLVGDAPAHHLGRLARVAVRAGERAARTGLRNLAEYLAYERRDLVPAAEGRVLLNGIDA